MTIHILAEFQPLDGDFDEVRDLLARTVPLVTAEPGCRQYLLLEGKNLLILKEEWDDAEALRTHAKGSNLKDLTTSLEGKLSVPMTVRSLREVTG